MKKRQIVWILRHNAMGNLAIWIGSKPSEKEQVSAVRKYGKSLCPQVARSPRAAEFELKWNCNLERTKAE